MKRFVFATEKFGRGKSAEKDFGAAGVISHERTGAQPPPPPPRLPPAAAGTTAATATSFASFTFSLIKVHFFTVLLKRDISGLKMHGKLTF